MRIVTLPTLARARILALSLSFLGALLLAAPAALAVPTLNGQFDLTGEPNRLALGPDGSIWVTLSASASNNDLARVAPNGTVTEFDVANLDGSVGITAGPDGGDPQAAHRAGPPLGVGVALSPVLPARQAVSARDPWPASSSTAPSTSR